MRAKPNLLKLHKHTQLTAYRMRPPSPAFSLLSQEKVSPACCPLNNKQKKKLGLSRNVLPSAVLTQ